MAKTAPLPCGGLEQHLEIQAGTTAMTLIQCRRDASKAGVLVAIGGSPRVRDKVFESEGLSPLHFDDESIDRLAVQGRHRRGEIDQITIMGERTLEANLAPRVPEEADRVVGEFLCAPLIVVLREELDAGATEALGGEQGIVPAPSDGHVGAEKRHAGTSSEDLWARITSCCL